MCDGAPVAAPDSARDIGSESAYLTERAGQVSLMSCDHFRILRELSSLRERDVVRRGRER
jgi:hypothetical protein